jgi:hypothetical protein
MRIATNKQTIKQQQQQQQQQPQQQQTNCRNTIRIYENNNKQ